MLPPVPPAVKGKQVASRPLTAGGTGGDVSVASKEVSPILFYKGEMKMLKANLNTTYVADIVRTGTSIHGEYEMVLLKVNGDHARLPIWVQNVPCGIVEGGKFVIENILGVGIRHVPPSERYDKWQDEFSIEAIVKPIEA
jgi:hypothetical protein